MKRWFVRLALPGFFLLAGWGIDIMNSIPQWIGYLLWLVALLWGGIALGIWGINKRKNKPVGHTQSPARYAPEPYHHLVVVAGQSVVIGNVEENEENVSITGTVNNRQAAVVLKKRRLRVDLTPQQRWEQYAWELLEADRQRR